MFAIAINDIVESLKPDVNAALYVDDLALYCSASHVRTAERLLQLAINKVENWATSNGFRFSTAKTQCVHFCRVRNCFTEPSLLLYNKQISVKDSIRFLGLVFDRKLTWKEHFKYLRQKCFLSLNVLIILNHFDWGADRSQLLRIYRALVRSKLDYGSIVYSSARTTHLKTLDAIHNLGIRIATGAFRSSPVVSICAESGEPPLHIRQRRNILSYAAALSSLKDHPTYKFVFEPNFQDLYAVKPLHSRPLGIRLKEICNDLGWLFPSVMQTGLNSVPPWVIFPNVDTMLSRLDRSSTHPCIYKIEFLNYLSKFPNFNVLYTDGSKSAAGVGCSIVSCNSVQKFKLPSQCSIFTAELFALLKALEGGDGQDMIICSDSQSSLKIITQMYTCHPLASKIQDRIALLANQKKNVRFCWVPGHMGINGNERADQAAKEAVVHGDEVNIFIRNDVKNHAISRVNQTWAAEWDTLAANKLRGIKSTVTAWATSCRPSRREEVVLARLRIGHCRLTHSFLMAREQIPICDTCDVPVTVSHILVECVQFREVRERVGLSDHLLSIIGND